MTVDINSTTGEYHLVFNSAGFEDAGTYTCQDGEGIGEARAAWMAVLGQCLSSLYNVFTSPLMIVIIDIFISTLRKRDLVLFYRVTSYAYHQRRVVAVLVLV